MSPTTQLPILVIGGGPSGLVAALTLAQNRLPVRIVEKTTSFHRSARAPGLQPRSMELLRFLGVADDFRRLGAPIKPFRTYKLPGGTEIERTWTVKDFEPTPDRPERMLILGQNLTEGIFREHLSKCGVHVELGTEPTAIEQDADGVTVTLKKTASDNSQQTETVRAAYVIGADGGKGFTRRAIGASLQGQVKEGDGHVIADVEIDGLSDDCSHIWNIPGKATVTIRPTEEPGVYNASIIGENQDLVELSEDFDKFVAFIHENTGRYDIVFKRNISFAYWKPKMMIADKFREGKVFLAGDAAHLNSPTGGQGMNTGIQDSLNLGWKLALVHKGLAAPSLLSSYETERMPVVVKMLEITTELYTQIIAKKPIDGEKVPAAPNPDKNPRYRHPYLHMLDINYRWSPIVCDARTQGTPDDAALKARAYAGYPGEEVRAGDRAPQAAGLINAVGEEVGMFDLFKPTHHTVLIFSPSHDDASTAESVVRAIHALGEGLVRTVVVACDGVPSAVAGADVYHDRDGAAFRNYHVDGEKTKIIVVRPDGFIGAFVDDVDGLRTYFSRILGA